MCGNLYCLPASLISMVTSLPTSLFLTLLASSAGDLQVFLCRQGGPCGFLCFQGLTLLLLVMTGWVIRIGAEHLGRLWGTYCFSPYIGSISLSAQSKLALRLFLLSGPRGHRLLTIHLSHLYPDKLTLNTQN